MPWARRRILIWGKTRPELSKTYREIVCTGGVFEHSRGLVRLYPIPLRYMDDEARFKKYQWIETEVIPASETSDADVRPESYRIRTDVEVEVIGEPIPTGKNGSWQARAEWLIQPQNLVASVEELQDRQARDRTSLGILQPKTIEDIKAVRVADSERDGFNKRHADLCAQMDFPIDEVSGREIRPLMAPHYHFQVKFRCDDARCEKSHTFKILDWEVYALHRGIMRRRHCTAEAAAQEATTFLRERLITPGRDVRFFLGNFARHPQTFSIVGLWYPQRTAQTSLAF
jgi:hypothetical protein